MPKRAARDPGGTSLAELGLVPAADRGAHNVNEDATAPTPGQPCEITDDEMPLGNIPQLDGEDSDDLSDISDDYEGYELLDLSEHNSSDILRMKFKGCYKVHQKKITELDGFKPCERNLVDYNHKCDPSALNLVTFIFTDIHTKKGYTYS